VRPIVVPDDNVISFEIEGRADSFLCALDSRKEIVDKNVQLAVRREKFDVSLVRLNENFCKPCAINCHGDWIAGINSSHKKIHFAALAIRIDGRAKNNIYFADMKQFFLTGIIFYFLLSAPLHNRSVVMYIQVNLEF
jgi:hypothetical protein